MEVYVVGGYVRDTLMSREPKDMDFVVVGATPEDLLLKGFKQVGADFPVFLDKHGREWALARTERKTSPGYHGFEVEFDPGVTLEEDLYRRDFTINAMARKVLNPEEDNFVLDSEVIDPFNGKEDVKKGVLRHVSDHFNEDPVRALRAARLAARYQFTIASQTFDIIFLMRKAGELKYLTKERVWLEFEKAVDERCSGPFFRNLRDLEILEVIFPSIVTSDFYGMCRLLNGTENVHEALAVITSHIVEPDEMLNDMTIPAKVWAFVKKYHKLILDLYDLKKPLTSEEAIKLLNNLDIFRDKGFLYRAMRVSCCFDSLETTDEIVELCAYEDIIKNVGYEDLTDEQKETLSGIEIGNAINSLRIQVLDEVLSSR